jgi:Xaa-Pro aminopeptidase
MELKKILKKNKIDCFLITSPKNVFYLTGYRGFLNEEKDAKILITKRNNYLFTDKRYLGDIPYLKNLKLSETETFKEVIKTNKIKSAGFEKNSVTFSEFKLLKKIFSRLKPLNNAVEKLREIKIEAEIKNIKKACAIGDKAFKYIIKEIKTGVTEKDLETNLKIFIIKNGGEISFRPIIAFGKNSAVPHHQSSEIKLNKGMIVLLDFGVNYNGYCSDMTRTVFFGPPTAEFKKIHQIVWRAQKKTEELIRKSVLKIRASDIDKTARNYIIKNGYPSMPHSLGHGVGIEVHEKPNLSPKSKSTLKNGMVFSIEPGIYLNGFGGVRIEDLYLLKNNTLEKITHSTSEIISL